MERDVSESSGICVWIMTKINVVLSIPVNTFYVYEDGILENLAEEGDTLRISGFEDLEDVKAHADGIFPPSPDYATSINVKNLSYEVTQL
jgi:hypothetical protein